MRRWSDTDDKFQVFRVTDQCKSLSGAGRALGVVKERKDRWSESMLVIEDRVTHRRT